MFPASYFAPTYFAPTYWDKVGSSAPPLPLQAFSVIDAATENIWGVDPDAVLDLGDPGNIWDVDPDAILDI